MWTVPALAIDELPQTLTIKENVSPAPAPGDTSVKAEPLASQEKQSDGSTSSPQPPPPSVTVKTEVKKEEPEEKDGKENDDEEDESDKPCTKMTMRLRRNINNPQCVSRHKDAPRANMAPVIGYLPFLLSGKCFSLSGENNSPWYTVHIKHEANSCLKLCNGGMNLERVGCSISSSGCEILSLWCGDSRHQRSPWIVHLE